MVEKSRVKWGRGAACPPGGQAMAGKFLRKRGVGYWGLKAVKGILQYAFKKKDPGRKVDTYLQSGRWGRGKEGKGTSAAGDETQGMGTRPTRGLHREVTLT